MKMIFKPPCLFSLMNKCYETISYLTLYNTCEWNTKVDEVVLLLLYVDTCPYLSVYIWWLDCRMHPFTLTPWYVINPLVQKRNHCYTLLLSKVKPIWPCKWESQIDNNTLSNAKLILEKALLSSSKLHWKTFINSVVWYTNKWI